MLSPNAPECAHQFPGFQGHLTGEGPERKGGCTSLNCGWMSWTWAVTPQGPSRLTEPIEYRLALRAVLPFFFFLTSMEGNSKREETQQRTM